MQRRAATIFEMSKKKSEDALDHTGDRDKWLADYFVFEDDEPICVEFLYKTKFGLWKGVDVPNAKRSRDNDLYAEGRSLTCTHCNTSYNTRLRKPECPYCHRTR